MKPFTLREALEAMEGRYFGDPARLGDAVTLVTSDSRQVVGGALFIALKGARVDGHSFMKACLEKGAAACVTERVPADGETPAILVDSTVAATGRLAAWYRSGFSIPVIGITGSVGKTTTKEMISAVLAERYRTHKTQKNLNNELGVPWTLLQMEPRHQVSVVEMGISSFGEMRRLTRMVRPDIAVFTLIGDAHLEFLGDREGVLRAKSEIFEGMGPQGLAILNGDDPLQATCAAEMRRVTYGLSKGCDVRGEAVRNLGEAGMACTVRHAKGTFELRIPAFGSHLVSAALAASAVGLALGLTDEEIARGITRFQTVGDRARVIHTPAITMIADCYNANPNSCRAAVDSLMGLEGKRKVCILGDMLELGDQTRALHSDVGAYAARSGADLVVGCGPLAADICRGAEAAGAQVRYYPEKAALMEEIDALLLPGDCVLIKASRGMAFEDIVRHFA